MAKCFAEGVEELNIIPLKENLLKGSSEVSVKLTDQAPGLDKIKPKMQKHPGQTSTKK